MEKCNVNSLVNCIILMKSLFTEAGLAGHTLDLLLEDEDNFVDDGVLLYLMIIV